VLVGVARHYATYQDAWKEWWRSADPHRLSVPLDDRGRNYSAFELLLLLQAVRPDKLADGVRVRYVLACWTGFALIVGQYFVGRVIGEKTLQPATFDLSSLYRDSSTQTPIILIISPGADPTDAMLAFAQGSGFSKKIATLSLGQVRG
jgi:dynein heavy chain